MNAVHYGDSHNLHCSSFLLLWVTLKYGLAINKVGNSAPREAAYINLKRYTCIVDITSGQELYYYVPAII